MHIPEISVVKYPTPIIYLDTNVLIELSRFEKGCCENEHRDLIGKLYCELTLKEENAHILCASGNQLEEMGASKQRQEARNFIFRFTNIEFGLPNQIHENQLRMGYKHFMNDDLVMCFNSNSIIEHIFGDSSLEVFAFSTCSKKETEVFRQNKEELASTLNKMKYSGNVAENYDAQLDLELDADSFVFQCNLNHCNDSPENYMNMLDTIGLMYYCVGRDSTNVTTKKTAQAIENYKRFLVSSYNHNLPYVWIRSVLFAHIMQRQNKITQSDYADIKWASAYLPFVDYAVTDSAFCNLLNQSGLAELYGTKVYCLKTLGHLLKDIELESCTGRVLSHHIKSLK